MSSGGVIQQPAQQWSAALNGIGRLVAGALGNDSPAGTLSEITTLGPLLARRLTGTPQVMRRTARSAREEPTDLLKLSIVRKGDGVFRQDDVQLRVGPGQMVISEAARPLDIVVERPWAVTVLEFDRGAISLPRQVLRHAIRRVITLDDGPGAVLSGFISSAIRHDRVMGAAAGRIGEAGLHLIAGMLGATCDPGTDAAADAQRIRVLQYARTHLTDPDLTHDRIAAAHHMAPRTLHRLFENEPYTITEYIRLQRLKSAHLELADPLFRNRSIAAVAARWGFLNQAHFTRAFQALYGVTPSSVRRSEPTRPSRQRPGGEP